MAEENAQSSGGSVLSHAKKERNFDVRSWKGLTAVLSAARSAGMSGDEYAVFRDTVLAYAKSGGTDAALRKTIEAKTKTFGMSIADVPEEKKETVSTPERTVETQHVAPPAPEKKNPHMPQVHLGAARRAPTFFVSQEKSNTPQETEKVSPPPKEVPVRPPVPKMEPVVETAPPIKIAPPEPLKPVAIQEEPAEAPPTVSIEASKARIEEIKHIIASEIGNPAALLDETAEVGREYMQALVAAMKAVSGAAPGTLGSSMKKLEDVFPRVRQAAKDHEMKKAVAEVEVPAPRAPVEVPVPITSEPEIEKVTEPVVEVVKKEPIPEPVEIPKEPEITPEPEPESPKEESLPEPVLTTPEPPMEEVPLQHEERAASIADAYERAKAALTKVTPPEAAIPPAGEIPQDVEETPEVTKEEPAPQPIPVPEPVLVVETPAPKPPVQKLPSLDTAQRAPVKEDVQSSPFKKPEPAPEPEREEKQEPEPTPEKSVPQPTLTRREPIPPVQETYRTIDNLHTPDIDAGLREIINSWSIFRGGGLFGLGKGGVESDLWQKLKDAPMTVVATGRWEGADQEAILSMRDYISGWRHEQGLWYVPTETFEMYLRRVVKRVLERSRN